MYQLKEVTDYQEWNDFQYLLMFDYMFILSIQFCIGKPQCKGKYKNKAKYNNKLSGERYVNYDQENQCKKCKGKVVTVLNWFVLLCRWKWKLSYWWQFTLSLTRVIAPIFLKDYNVIDVMCYVFSFIVIFFLKNC